MKNRAPSRDEDVLADLLGLMSDVISPYSCPFRIRIHESGLHGPSFADEKFVQYV
jgi:hypothetical protein